MTSNISGNKYLLFLKQKCYRLLAYNFYVENKINIIKFTKLLKLLLMLMSLSML